MRQTLLIIILTILTLTGFAQTQSYGDVAIKCTTNFQEGLTNIPADSLDKVFGERLSKLRECFIGLKFPDFSLTSIEGKRYQLSDLKGKVIMLNFWFIGCAPCVAEMPLLNQLAEEYRGQDFLLLTFSTDDKESILNFRKKRKIKYEIFEKSRDLIQNTFHLSYGYPTNIILDKTGKIVEFKLGGALEEEKLQKIKSSFKGIIETELRR